MPRLNMQAIRGRVDRLIDKCPKRDTFLIRWEQTDDHCPACGYDIGEHVLAAARIEAATSDRYCIWVDTWNVATCPQCGGPNPHASIDAIEQSKRCART